MQIVLASILAMMMLITIIIATRVQIDIHYSRQEQDDLLITELKAWYGLIKMRNETTVIAIEDDLSGVEYELEMETPQKQVNDQHFKVTPEESIQLSERLSNIAQKVHHLHAIIGRFFKRIRISKFVWQTRFGTGDAAQTGLLAGFIWAAKGNLLGLLSSMFLFSAKPQLHVQPLFQGTVLDVNIQCMIHLRMGQAILTGIRMLRNLK